MEKLAILKVWMGTPEIFPKINVICIMLLSQKRTMMTANVDALVEIEELRMTVKTVRLDSMKAISFS